MSGHRDGQKQTAGFKPLGCRIRIPLPAHCHPFTPKRSLMCGGSMFQDVLELLFHRLNHHDRTALYRTETHASRVQSIWREVGRGNPSSFCL